MLGRLDDRGARSGRCRNDLYCSLASKNRTLQIAKGERFACPECLKPLQDPSSLSPPRPHRRTPLVMVGGGLVAMALCLLLARGAFLGGHAAVLVRTPPAQTLPTTQTAAKPDQRAEVLLDAATVERQRVFTYAMLGPMPPAVTVPKFAAPHSRMAALSVSFPENRGFNGQSIAGGEPDFPDQAASQRLTGLVRVTCLIEADGRPTDCDVTAVKGGHSFRDSTLSWLKSGKVRFAPIVHHGEPVAAVHSWDIEFSPDPPDE